MFKVDLLKSNKKYIVISIIFIVMFAIMNLFINTETVFSELGDNSNGINKLVINELMSSNSGSYIDEKGNLCDWIEIYNGYNYTIQLKNYGLSDSMDGRIKWIFPDIEIQSKEYLIIHLTSDSSNNDSENLHAPFSLKQDGGEYISLKKPNGKTVDAVKTVRLEKNASMARDEEGKWIITKEITPGYENSKEGREFYLSNYSHKDKEYPIALTEFLPMNEGNIIFNEDKLYSYIEVTNISEETIDLQNYYLSNSEETIYKWRFPNVQLKKGESYLVYTDSQNINNHASFRLKHKTGNVLLATYDGIIENVKYEELPNGIGYVKENNKWKQNTNISPGYNNTEKGKEQFQKEIDITKKDLIISEVMSSNNQFLPQNGNQFYDWIELYNNSDHSIQLSEYTLSTDYEDMNMYTLPEKELPAGGYYILMASGNSKLSNNSYSHTNFKLSSGTGLYLFKNTLIDSLYIYSIPKGYSYGRSLNNGHFYYVNPTPGNSNSELALRKIMFDPMFNIEGGIYNNIESLTIEIDNSSFGEIYYTLDGSIPTTSSIRYKGPFVINHTTVVRAVSYINGVRVSEIVTNSYIINENHSLPVMSISMPNESFQSVQRNVYGNTSVAAHADFYENKSGFSIDCNFKLFGGDSRYLSKKSYSLQFDYGNLHYKVFDYKNLWEFNALVLRSGSQDQSDSMMRDELATTIAIKYGTLDAQASKPVVLYLNGNYWGIYYIREKINAKFIENNHNVSGITNITDYNYTTEEGSNSPMIQLRNYAASHNLSSPDHYNYISTLLDIDNYIDLWVFQFIVNNYDIHNYRYYSNPNISNGKIRMVLFDLDYAMRFNQGSEYLNYIQYPEGSQSFVDTRILIALMQNESFKKRFVERTAYYLKNVWTKDNIQKEYDLLYNAVSPEMARNSSRWGFDYYQWVRNAESLKNFSLNRIYQVPNEIKNYFHLSQEEVNAYFSG